MADPTKPQTTIGLGRLGVWSGSGQLGSLRAADARSAAREIEDLGYSALWIPESTGKEAFSHAATLLAATDRIIVATGIANIWARDPTAMMNGARTLGEAFPGRFVLGIGVSHAPVVRQRGHRYEGSVKAITEYLDAMTAATYRGPSPPTEVPVILGALGPHMLRAAATRTAGAHPYFVPVEHTRRARLAMGPTPILAPEQAIILQNNMAKAQEMARAHMSRYLALDHYVQNLRRLGWSNEHLANGGSDDLVDAIVAYGAPETANQRVLEHLAAGADHVCVQAFGEDPSSVPLGDLGRLMSDFRTSYRGKEAIST